MKKREEAEKQLVQTKKEILDAFQMRNGLPFDFQHHTFVVHVKSRQLIKAVIRNEYWVNETLNLEGSYRKDLLEES